LQVYGVSYQSGTREGQQGGGGAWRTRTVRNNPTTKREKNEDVTEEAKDKQKGGPTKQTQDARKKFRGALAGGLKERGGGGHARKKDEKHCEEPRTERPCKRCLFRESGNEKRKRRKRIVTISKDKPETAFKKFSTCPLT